MNFFLHIGFVYTKEKENNKFKFIYKEIKERSYVMNSWFVLFYIILFLYALIT